jgi:hypothetical protein
VHPVLADAGDDDTARSLIEQLFSRGTGAHIQRKTYRESGHLPGVIATAIALTQE